MGGGLGKHSNTSDATSKTINESVRTAMESVISNNLVYTTSTVNVMQIQTAIFKNVTIPCNVELSQDATVQNKIYQPMTASKKQDLETELNNDLQSLVTKDSDQTSSGALGKGNSSNTTNGITSNDISNLSLTIANTTQSVVNNAITVSQEQNLTFIDSSLCYPGGTLSGVQNINTSNLVDNIFNSTEVTDAVNTMNNKLASDTAVSEEQTKKGLDIGGKLGIIIAVIVVIAIIVGGIVAYKKYGKSSSTTTTTATQPTIVPVVVTAPQAPAHAAFGRGTRRLKR